MQKLSSVTAHYMQFSVFDHFPMLFECAHNSGGGGRPFKFLNVLADHP